MILELSNIGASYGNTPILRDIDIHVKSGEIVGIMGRNGVGKTTLIKTIIGLLASDEGSIYYKGDNITESAANERARDGMGYIPQGREVFPDLTVNQNLQMGLQISQHKDEKLIDEVYEYFPRLYERQNQEAGTMSGGEQQMLAIGRALAGNPDILLLDEPSEGIQPSIVNQIRRDIRKINETMRITILFVEQNLQFIQDLAERCYIIDKGRIEGELSRSELSDTDSVAEYLAI